MDQTLDWADAGHLFFPGVPRSLPHIVPPPREATSDSGGASGNARFCKTYRAKRRAQEEELRTRVGNLEHERHALLARIAELQCELQALRYAGEDDLEKENALLRAEVQQHREFLGKMMRTAESAPGMLDEERVRLLRGATQSGQGHLVGMLYVSSTWSPLAAPMQLPRGITARTRAQLLPTDAAPAEAKRFNSVTSFGWLQCSSELLWDQLWAPNADVAAARQRAESLWPADGTARTFEEVLAPSFMQTAEALGTRDVRVYRYSETRREEAAGSDAPPELVPERARCDVIFSISRFLRELSPRTFLATSEMSEADLASLPEGPTECLLFATTSCSKELRKAELVPSDDGALSDMILQGSIIVPHASDKSRCFHAMVMSVPLGHLAGAGNAGEVLSERGEASSTLEAHLRSYFAVNIDPHHA